MARLPRLLSVAVLVFIATGSANAAPIRVTYDVTAEIASLTGIGPNADFAGTVTLEFADGDPFVGGALVFPNVSIVSGQMSATGSPLELDDGLGGSVFVSTLDWSAGATDPFASSSFVAFFGSGFQSSGIINPGSFFLSTDWTVAGDNATGTVAGTEVSRQVVPEPGSAALLAVGLSWLGLRRRR